ncbi:solute carrier family 35 member SLC35F1/F2/F6, partial [Piptocephalis cylindrospora]
QFAKTLLLGQALAFCITATNVTSTALASNHGVSIPTTQSFLNYVLLALVFNGVGLYRDGLTGWGRKLRARWWKYALLALVDVEGNYFVVKSFSYTSLLSAMLLDCWAIPVVVFLSIITLRLRYAWSHYLGLIVCLAGVLLLLFSDIGSGDGSAPDPIKGDLFCLLGATLYGISNVLEEKLVRQYAITDVIGGLGMFGMVFNGIQLGALEHEELRNVKWTPPVVGMILGFDLALFLFYSLTPVLFRLAGATFFNLSLLTSDIYGLLFGMLIFGEKYNRWYPAAYVGIVAGVVIFNL